MTKTAFRLVSARLASSCLGPARFAPALALGIGCALPFYLFLRSARIG